MKKASQAEFARLIGVAKSYVTELKKAGRLVITDDGMVDVEESKKRIEQTAEPSREDVASRWKNEREARAVQSHQQDRQDDKIGNSYQTARAIKEKYAAMSAKLEYERAIGKLIEKDEVSKTIEDVVSIIRQALENMPHRASADLVGKDLDAIRATLKQQVHGALSEMERVFSDRISHLGVAE